MIESKHGSVALRQGTKLPIWFSSAISAIDLREPLQNPFKALENPTKSC